MSETSQGRPIGWEEVEQLFADFHYTAFRLEALQVYSNPDEKEPFNQFYANEKKGDPIALSESDWGDEVREGIAKGKRYDRVHVVTEPLSDYIRFECAWGYRRNVKSGEGVRIIPIKKGDWPDGIPKLDYWLFDSHRLLRMNYANDGTLITTELVDDLEQVVAANVWRDRAIHLSIPFAEYEASFDAYMHPR